MDGNRLVKVMQDIASNSNKTNTDLIFGEVVSMSPLKIKVDNRFIVDESFLLLSNQCYKKEVSFTLGGQNVIIMLWRGLQIGDKVNMLRVHASQLFYVIERKEV